jgi:hypothetical protein
VARFVVDLCHILIFGICAGLLNPIYFLLTFCFVVLASTFEIRWPKLSERHRSIFNTKLRFSFLASLGWTLSGMLADWQSQGPGSRVLGRMLGIVDWNAGQVIVHAAHWILFLALLSLLEFGIKNLNQAFRDLYSTSKPQ